MTVFLDSLRDELGRSHVLTSERQTWPYKKGFRYGCGPVEAVLRPASLVSLWRVARLCVQAGRIIIMQAANTGLTGGSTPDGADYDRPVIIISTTRLRGLHLLDHGAEKGRQVVCLPGARLYELENALAPLGREPHSVIGSSCIGASVLGGVSNNSGGALVQRGPAYTEMALFGQVDASGNLRLVNHLGITLYGTEEEILDSVEQGRFAPEQIDWKAGAGHDSGYQARLRDVDADSPARFNADKDRLYEASGCAGKLIVFAVRLDTFPKEAESSVFYLGTNSPQRLENLRRVLLTEFETLPISGEYLHRDIFAMTDRYGRDTMAVIRFLGTRCLPLFFSIKGQVDSVAKRSRFLPDALSDKFLQMIGTMLPSQVPTRIRPYQKRFEHHLILHAGSALAEALRPRLKEFFAEEGDFIECTPKEAEQAFLLRFAAAGAAGRYKTLYRRKTGGLVTFDVALRRNEQNWFETLPQEIEEKLHLKLYYGHFLCHVMHQNYIVKKGVDPIVLEHEMWRLFDQRGARYPAEHNIGHLYHASDDMVSHYRKLDPCNCMNPGIGLVTKARNWVAETVEAQHLP